MIRDAAGALHKPLSFAPLTCGDSSLRDLQDQAGGRQPRDARTAAAAAGAVAPHGAVSLFFAFVRTLAVVRPAAHSLANALASWRVRSSCVILMRVLCFLWRSRLQSIRSLFERNRDLPFLQARPPCSLPVVPWLSGSSRARCVSPSDLLAERLLASAHVSLCHEPSMLPRHRSCVLTCVACLLSVAERLRRLSEHRAAGHRHAGEQVLEGRCRHLLSRRWFVALS